MRGDAGDAGTRGRFFEKKLGKKLPCRVVARLNIYDSKNSFVGLQLGKKAFAELFSKSDNASLASPASPYKSEPTKVNAKIVIAAATPLLRSTQDTPLFSGGGSIPV